MKPVTIMIQAIEAAALRRDGLGALGEQHQQRRAGRRDADADHDEGNDRERDAEEEMRRHQRGRDRRQRAAGCMQRHAADDPGRAPAAEIGAIAETRTQQLHRIMQADENARQHRGQRQLHHHDAVERRHGEHRHRAERGLHQAEADNAEPGERRRRVIRSFGDMMTCARPLSKPCGGRSRPIRNASSAAVAMARRPADDAKNGCQ